jgi:hypothetical protein
MASGQSVQFTCSKCRTVLKEATSPDRPAISEECPGCGCQLSETLQVQLIRHPSRQRAKFQTAYEINLSLGLGINEIDSFLALRLGDRLCIAGGHANQLVTRLCIRAFLPARQGGLGAGSVVFVDAGNSSDVYRCASIARQLGLEVRKVLRGIVVSRAFTIHQLAALVARGLPEAVRQHNARLVVVSDLLRMFTEDPQVSRKEASYLINEIVESVRRIDNALLVMSIRGGSPYDSQVMQSFVKRIEVDLPDVKIYNGRGSKRVRIAR